MAAGIHPWDVWLSGHARTRCQQRGILRPALELLTDEADHLVPGGSGCMALTLSRAQRRLLRRRGIGASEIDRAARRAIVVGADGGIITVLYPNGSRGRRYRHRFHSHPSHQR